MSEKISTQVLIDAFAKKHGVSKKVAEALSKSFFDTIEEGLKTDGVVKVNGLGTFKIVDVASRESVNVNTGERFVIAGYKKVSLVPEVEISSAVEEPSAVEEVEMPSAVEEVEMPSAVDEVEMPLAVDEVEMPSAVDEVEMPSAVEDVEEVEEDTKIILEEHEPQNVEVPKDEFSGIDMIIATPESIDEVKAQVEAARVRAKETLAAAQEAQDELRRLECLLERLVMPSVVEMPSAVEEVEEGEGFDEVDEVDEGEEVDEVEGVDEVDEVDGVDEVDEGEEVEEGEEGEEDEKSPVEVAPMAALTSKVVEEKIVEEVEKPAAVEKVERPAAVEEFDDDDDDEEEGGMSWWVWLLIPIVGVALAFAAIYGYKYIQQSEEDEQRQFQERYDAPKDVRKEETKVAKPASTKDTLVKKDAAKPEPVKADVAKPEPTQPATPKTYVMQKGDYLTRISQKIYGTKDSVQAIIKLNKFADPNNVPIGSTIKLP